MAGKPGQSISDRSVEVEWLLHSDQLRLDSDYYIRRKLIPPLERIFNLVGANVRQWYDEMPKYHGLRKVIRQRETEIEDGAKLATLEVFMDKDSSLCPICGGVAEMEYGSSTVFHFFMIVTKSYKAVCEDCLITRDVSYYEVKRRLADLEERNNDLHAVCRSCSGISWLEEVACNSQDCPVYYSRLREASKAKYEEDIARPLLETLAAKEEEREPDMGIVNPERPRSRGLEPRVQLVNGFDARDESEDDSNDLPVGSVNGFDNEGLESDLEW